ncbi:MAG: hypothetical protein K2G63_05815 [Oscillospiraceae bacterium]|nr:hypothetical protein [Oscillospiraceae bacterium]
MNTTEILQPNLFPFPFPHHLVFCCIAMIFFGYLYMKYKKPHQLIMAIAIPFSLIVWISESRTLFYAMGLIEVVLIIFAIVTNIIHKKKYPELYASNNKSDIKTESKSEEKQNDLDKESEEIQENEKTE